jgi:hypothetical protein
MQGCFPQFCFLFTDFRLTLLSLSELFLLGFPSKLLIVRFTGVLIARFALVGGARLGARARRHSGSATPMRAWSLGGRAATAAALALRVRGGVRMTAARPRR